MENIIGFGGTFYTLWSMKSETVYATSPNGKHYPSYEKQTFNYHKNISKDIEVVKAMYPGITIDKGLRGNRTFTIEKQLSSEDPNPEILGFGKYAGRDIREVVQSDLDYVLYMIENFDRGDEVWSIAKQTPEYLEYIAEQQRIKEERIASFKPLKSGKTPLTAQSNPYLDDLSGLYKVWVPTADGHNIELRFRDAKYCTYMDFEYYLPIFSNGKARRIKNKEIEYHLEVLSTEICKEHGTCFQVANVLN